MEDLSFPYPGAKVSDIHKFLSYSLPVLFVSEPKLTMVSEYQYKNCYLENFLSGSTFRFITVPEILVS